MGIKSNLLIQATKYNNKGIIKLTQCLFNALDKLFSSAKRSAKKKESTNNRKDNQHLNDALALL
ncbi:hypothetical protein EJB10_00080 [Wolbachia endosymbiont of Brugia malayi]|uniref:hypothetical protein n=1 Tax=unclassified Wolbachia TaxID=2640676 RepID=UPI00004C9418|nr:MULTISPECIES: hypothetical protein [unclassified Wolbachia]AAW71112.1 Predicted protein [Wolbachia endosymbiont strain TRS of Brugia malayi]QCB61318.1 hypothetical protein EJB10_00080 [Wolbachia endosymbiont of Brugia malayi]